MASGTRNPFPGGPQGAPYPADGGIPPIATEGVLGKRLFAYLIDLMVVFLLVSLIGVGIFVLGFLTFGLGWGLFALLPLTGILYSGITVGGPAQSTYGMRIMGLRVVTPGGARVGFIEAAVHALLFYLAAGTFLLWCLDLLIGFVRADRRLGHDLLVGLAVVRER